MNGTLVFERFIVGSRFNGVPFYSFIIARKSSKNYFQLHFEV